MNSKKIGKILRALRGEQEAKVVAQALGISLSSLFMYERGEIIPRDQVKIKFAHYYGKSVQDIFFSERAQIVHKEGEQYGKTAFDRKKKECNQHRC